MKGAQRLFRQLACTPQGNIECARGMAFRKNEMIVLADVFLEQKSQRVDGRQVPASVTHTALIVHTNETPADLQQELGIQFLVLNHE